MERFDQFSTLENDLEHKNFETFEEISHNFGKTDGDMTLFSEKNVYFHYLDVWVCGFMPNSNKNSLIVSRFAK